MPDFLLEIGCEEIPARMIDAASAELRERVSAMLSRERLNTGEISSFNTPRRLTMMASGITAVQPDITEQVNGPSVSAAYKDGQPTPAAHGFARKAGVDVSQLEIVNTPKGDFVSAKVTKKGGSAAEILAQNLPKEISSIYWPKNMYWRKPNERFVRPVRWLVAMLDGEMIPLEFGGIRAGNTSRGHRILSDGGVTIPRAGSAYVDALRAAKVLGRGEREHQIRKALDAATRLIPGARWREDKSLLETVVNLTEFPSAILGGFDPQFLALPEEVLVTVMRDHQKYFAIEDGGGKLLPHFLAVLNTDGDPQGLIRHGNERVLRARFNDARFFWQTDQKKSLLERLDLLRNVTFQKDLGSYYDKTRRVQRLCSWLSQIVKESGMTVRAGVVHKAACLAKTDLTTELVKEFTELQGIVGGLYARVQTLDPSLPEATRFAVADAIYDHYKPESTEDEVPRSLEGAVLSVGDKADTIAGMFALGLVPSGSKDPFALRRQANGIIKVIAEKKLPIGLMQLFSSAREYYRGSEAESHFGFYPDPKQKFVEINLAPGTFETKFKSLISVFMLERLSFFLKESRGFAYDVVNAVLAADCDDVVDAVQRAEAVSRVRGSVEFQSISAAFKRMKNLLRQARERGIEDLPRELRADLFDEAERQLYREMRPVGTVFQDARQLRRYGDALSALASLAPFVDLFFDNVMVMVDDPKVRDNRLLLLNQLEKSFGGIADFSEIVTEGKT